MMLELNEYGENANNPKVNVQKAWYEEMFRTTSKRDWVNPLCSFII